MKQTNKYNRLVNSFGVKIRKWQDVLIIGKLLRASATNPHWKLCARTRVMTGSNGNNAEDWTIRCDYLTTLKESVWYGIIDRKGIGSWLNNQGLKIQSVPYRKVVGSYQYD